MATTNTPEPQDDASAPRKQRRSSPGFSQRKHRMRRELAYELAQAQRLHPDWDDEKQAEEAARRLADRLPSDRNVEREYLASAPVSWCPNRRDIFDLVEVSAIRSSDMGRTVEALLRYCKHGRGSNRLLSVSTFERMSFEKGLPEAWQNLQGFFTDHRLLHWAYDFPVARGGTRAVSNIYATMGAALDRNGDGVCVALNIKAILKLREYVAEPESIGRVVLVDGTEIPSPREQRQYDKNWPEEEAFLRDGLENSDFSSHTNDGYTSKAWRGPRLIMLVDVATGLVLAWAIVKGTRPEWEVLEQLFQAVYAEWPEWDPEVLVGDAHFDNEECHRMCEERYGIHPIFPRGTPVTKKLPEHADFGTPTCPFHGRDHMSDMKLVQSEGFVDGAARRAQRLKPGEPADLSKAAHRWVCTSDVAQPNGSVKKCDFNKRTMWKTMPRLYVYYPEKGKHRSRMAKRNALLRRRNNVEAVNAWIKGKGIGLKGQGVPKWVSTDQQQRWLVSACILGFTLRRLVHADGTYEQRHADAAAKNLLCPSPATTEDLADIAGRLRSAAGRSELEARLEEAALLSADAELAEELAELLQEPADSER